jgi:hypothetical protein
VVSAPVARWSPRPLQVEVDLAHGGRWTSLRSPEREWLWSRPEPRRAIASPGAAFVDAGGLEECLPTVRGTPDHGWAWTMPWGGAPEDAHVSCGDLTLRRRLRDDAGAVVAGYRLDGPPGEPFVHAAHALLGLSAEAYVDAAPGRVLVTDDPRPLGVDVPWRGGMVEADWPDPWGLPLHRMGPDNGTAVGMVLPDRSTVRVVDGDDALVWDIETLLPHAVALWRNLGGFPPGASYRSTGVEPMVGSTFDSADRNRAAVVPPSGTATWTFRATAWRRSA